MLMDNMNWMDLQKYLQIDTRLVIASGSTEQHGFLSLGTDRLIPEMIAKQACVSEQVVLAPSIPFGVGCWTSAYPGSLGMKPQTFMRMVGEILESVWASL